MKQKLQHIKMIIFDVDGVLSNGDITYTDSGAEIKTFDVQDGLGITMARMAGLKTGIITGRNSSIVQRRAQELKVDAFSQGHFNKTGPYEEIKKKFALEDHEICYMGDDLLDLPLLNRVGFSVAVANGREEVKAVCDYVTAAVGGRGAVRETVELILKRQGKFEQLLESLSKSEDQ
ncbi:MAG: HAD-IIIA family hydrolase [Calditrichales bacterium]|nr:MAG: HAD-IIIA family hydrolase [Calditrichales bacterium]